MIYTVKIGNVETRIRMSPETKISEFLTANEYDGGMHNISGLIGAIINKAVEKIYGKDCYWFGNVDNLYIGQVLRSGGYAVTKQVVIEIMWYFVL